MGIVRNRWTRAGALALTGVSYAAMAPHLNWWFLHPVALLPWLWAVQDLRGDKAFMAGWFMGVTAQCSIFTWLIHTMQVFSNLPIWLAIPIWILFGLGFGLYGGVVTYLLPRIRERFGPWWPFGLGFLFIGVQSFAPQLFPWYEGVIWYRQSWVFQIAALGGTALVGFLAVATNGVLFDAVSKRRLGLAPAWKPAALLVALWLGAVGFSLPRVASIDKAMAEADTVRVAIVQNNVPLRPNKGDPEVIAAWQRAMRTRLKDYMDASRLAAEDGAEIIVWPEAALHRNLAGKNRAARLVQEAFATWNAEGLLGGIYSDRDDGGRRRDYNSAFFVRRDGSVGERYDKIILLPFGEFMPGLEILPFLDRIEGVGRLTPGVDRVIWDGEHGKYAYLICYEAIRHNLVRKFVNDGTTVLFNGTNDAWFGEGGAAFQHAMLATIRSVELGVPLVRAANSGTSLWADVAGREHRKTDIYVKALPVFDLPLLTRNTPMRRFGNWFAVLCLAIAAIGARPGSLSLRRTKKSGKKSG